MSSHRCQPSLRSIQPSENKHHNKTLYEKYFAQDELYEYATKTLNIKSPIVIDLNINGSWHSQYYLASAYSVYKKLKLKHANTAQSFDILLGLK